MLVNIIANITILTNVIANIIMLGNIIVNIIKISYRNIIANIMLANALAKMIKNDLTL